MQCKACEEGMVLHAKVRPDSMKDLHQRMEGLMADFR